MSNKKTKFILCIEDEPEMIDLIRLILERRGFNVQGAAGGVEGIKKVRELHPDLVLLDLMMPDMDGWEVYQQMKADESTRNIPVIVVTAKAQSIDKCSACTSPKWMITSPNHLVRRNCSPVWKRFSARTVERA
jgi:CheY-like chemotaxis protein